LNQHQRIGIAVLTTSQDDVEVVNKTLRDGGHAAHCQWIRNPSEFDKALHSSALELVILDCDTYPDSVRQVIKQKDTYKPEMPALAIKLDVDEAAILDVMKQGAVDLVSIRNRERLQAVVSRELRACRVERALNSTLQSATTYRKQLYDYMEGSASAIAYVQEGIVTNANQSWLTLFQVANKDDVIGLPLMDNFEVESQAAIKGAIIATTKRKWQTGEKLNARAKLGDSNVDELELDFQLAEFDDGDHVQIRISPPSRAPVEPTKLVHDALKRDPTTLFFHRAQFLERITRRLAKKPASGLHVLVYIKPDDFSKISSKVGLIASEDVLAQFSEEVRKRMHPRDVAGRFEGTVIMALLERGNKRDAEVWAQQLVDHIQSTQFAINKQDVSITCTVGVCAVSGVFDNMDELVSAAAQAHKLGRNAGGNAVSLNDSPDEDTKLRRHDAIWVKRIKAAMIERRFRLAHLPIAGLRSDSIAMFDMLIRMLDEQGKPILPSEFLPAAERNNLMKTLDRWIIGAAMEYCANESADRVFVRLSRHSMQDLSLIPWLIKEFAKHAIEPGRICLQVNEEEAARYIKQTKSMVGELRKLGLAFALEHYGVDKGRIQILDILKPDYIKIDGELMHSLTTDTAMQDKVRHVANAAAQRGIETIAERVENANTMAVLFQLGVHYMQGHYVHEPEVVLQEAISATHTSLEAIAGR
jgi:diguanylate cyclase (GGDEF)-like protein